MFIKKEKDIEMKSELKEEKKQKQDVKSIQMVKQQNI